MLNLNNITIVSINGRDPENSAKAIEYSCKNINFYEKLIITNQNLIFKDIKTILVSGLNSIEDYNFFCIKELFKYIETEYCLIIQPDGYIINPHNWTDDFLKYDYIGAPWPTWICKEVLNKCNLYSFTKNLSFVGNGGFSLRSKKFLKATSTFDYEDTSLAEDIFISAYKRKELKNNFNILYAPVKIAQLFSLENIVNEFSTSISPFGFHGKLNHLEPYLKLLK